VCPYLAFEALFAMQHNNGLLAGRERGAIVDAYTKGINVGILKVRARVCGCASAAGVALAQRCAAPWSARAVSRGAAELFSLRVCAPMRVWAHVVAQVGPRALAEKISASMLRIHDG